MPQKISHKIAEVKFRKKLSLQHLGKLKIFPNELEAKEMLQELKKRLAETIVDFTFLEKIGVNFTPYLEIGAEYSARSSLLENHFKAKGFACDISQVALASASSFAKKLKFSKIPKRICCDAENLPFAKNSFSFVFCYQTIHHFQNPAKLISEIARVTKPGGYFFFSEEPVRQTLNLSLWRRPTKLRPFEKLLKFLLVLPFVSQIGKSETASGIFEGTFNLKTWQKILSPFEEIEVKLKPFPFGPESQTVKNSRKNWIFPSPTIRFFLEIFGGGISGLAKIKKNQVKEKNNLKEGFLICPDCKIKRFEIILKKGNRQFFCPRCGRSFKNHFGVWQFLNSSLAKKLYEQA